MTHKLFAAALMCILGINICKAQLSDSSSSKWGGNSFGSQLSIEMNTNVITIGSKLTFQCRVRNTSTNDIFFSVTDPKYDFQISVFNDSGKTYQLSPNPATQAVFLNPLMHKLSPGETYEQAVTLKIDGDIVPGNYKLKCRFTFYVNTSKNNGGHELESNIIEVQII